MSSLTFALDPTQPPQLYNREERMTAEEFASLLELGYEQRGVEFKGPGSRTDTRLSAKVVRAMLGMANLRDGGLVVIGVQDENGGLNPCGLEASDLGSWTYDHLASTAAEYASPAIRFDLVNVEHQGKAFVVVRVQPFEDVPVLCAKEYSREREPGQKPELILRRGACYVRSHGKPATTEVARYEEMRELLDIAAERRLRAFLGQAARAGVDITRLIEASDVGAFARERELPSPPLVREIESRGYWTIIVRPETYQEARVASVADLGPLVERLRVQLRGWDFPHLRHHTDVSIEMHSISHATDWQHQREWWRLFQSGQLIQVSGFASEWRDRSTVWGAPQGWTPGGALNVSEVVYTCTEVYEYAARLAVSEAGDEHVRVETTLRGVRDWELYFSDPGRILSGRYATTLDEIPVAQTVSRSELVADPRALARMAAKELLLRFNYRIADVVLRQLQGQLRES
jgi:hypothetical protein